MASSYSDRDLDLVPHITFSFAENYIKSIKKSSGQKIFNKGFKYFHESYVCDLKGKFIFIIFLVSMHSFLHQNKN